MPKHILIVDDSKTVRNLVAFIMRKEGFKVTAAEDGLDGLEKLYIDKQVDLIILGFNQPEVTKESLDEYVEVGDIVPLSRQLFQWIQSLTFSKLVKVPNGEAEKA